ncbi:hypothetical protein [Leptolyngbya sp. FACHB-16]|nr:hypothetical protein [Leptolyngbya sp. FACHB-16]
MDSGISGDRRCSPGWQFHSSGRLHRICCPNDDGLTLQHLQQLPYIQP